MLSVPRLVLVASAGLIAAPASAERLAEVIFTNIEGNPTSQVPGTDESFRAPLTPFLTLYGSPDGQHWVFKGFTDNPDSNLNDVIVAGTGTTGLAVAKEGDAAPGTAFTYGFMDSDCGVNDAGEVAFGNRLSGGAPTSADESIFRITGGVPAVAVQEGQLAPNLQDPSGPKGDEIYGNSLNSAHILNDGTVAYKADLIDNVDPDFESALYHDPVVRAQEGTSLGTFTGIDVYDSFAALSGNTFSSSADGAHWIVEADVEAGLGTTEAVVVDDAIQIRDGDVLDGLTLPVDAIFGVDIAGNGDWFARGGLADDSDWVVRNGELVAATGDPITNDFAEAWGFSFQAANANTAGDWIVAGLTDDPDLFANQVVVLNCSRVIARRGDPVDLDGNGLPDDDLFLGAIGAADVFLSDDLNDDLVDDRYLYLFADILDGAGTNRGDAFVRIALDICLGDVDGDAEVNVDDLVEVITKWGLSCVAADTNFDGEVDVNDLVAVITGWGECP